jgi:hypothetical protein
MLFSFYLFPAWNGALVGMLQCAVDLDGFGEGVENSAPFACTGLTRDLGDAFGSSATTWGSSFSFVYPDFGLSFIFQFQRKVFAR